MKDSYNLTPIMPHGEDPKKIFFFSVH
jgi:hypothetical protein